MIGDTNLLGIFFTGLLTGGLTCLAVQGGLLASTIAQREQSRLSEEVHTGNAKPILFFLIAKLIAYTLLGFLLGWFGSLFQFSLRAQVLLQALAVFFLFGTALNLLNVHPFFRYFAIQPPRFLTRMVRNQSKSRDMFAPALLGAFTVFIPCGATQAMMALAIASGHALSGAAILFSFVLGTSPLFFLLGYFATKLEDTYQKKFYTVAAIAIIFLAFFNLKSILVLTGVDFGFFSLPQGTVSLSPDSQIDINITSSGYSPENISVKAGSAVTLRLTNDNAYTCAQAFTIPALGIQEIVSPGEQKTITFTAPPEPERLVFACSMGMFTGVIQVI